MTTKPRYYQLYQDGGNADLYIFGDITSTPWEEGDTSSAGLMHDLAQLGPISDLTVHINSYGGEVAEGAAIYNTLLNLDAHVTTVCEGMACSIASVIFMAGDDRVMQDASVLLIHNAWTEATGDSDELRKTADDLEKQNDISKAAYARSGIDPDTLKQLMDAETWLSSQEALDYGFATSVADPDQMEHAGQSARQAVCDRLTARQDVATVTVKPDLQYIHDVVLDYIEQVTRPKQEGLTSDPIESETPAESEPEPEVETSTDPETEQDAEDEKPEETEPAVEDGTEPEAHVEPAPDAKPEQYDRAARFLAAINH